MTEQIGDQISAFIDDELSENEGAFLVRRLDSDPGARGRAFRYMTIGCALRGELLSPDPAVLRRRIANVLAGGTVPPLARPKPRVAARFVRPLLGVGVAASVAVAALGAVRILNGPESGAALLDSGPQQMITQWREPTSYTVPQDPNIRNADVGVAQAMPTSLLMQHAATTSHLNRFGVYSIIAGAAEAESAGAAQADVASGAGGKAESANASFGPLPSRE